MSAFSKETIQSHTFVVVDASSITQLHFVSGPTLCRFRKAEISTSKPFANIKLGANTRPDAKTLLMTISVLISFFLSFGSSS